MSYFSLYDEGRQRLFSLQEGDNDARLLLLWAYQIDMSHLLSHYTDDEAEKKPEAAALYRQALELRENHVPLQYITQRQNFCGLEFLVNGNVLIPRQDTECLVEKVLENEKKISAEKSAEDAEGESGEGIKSDDTADKFRLLDLCTGSGCIAVALKVLGGYDMVVGSDISRDALGVADANAMLNGVEIPFYESNMFDQLKAFSRDKCGFDVIVSNPPYIKEEVLAGLMPEVRDFEPTLALKADENGLKFYRIIAEQAPNYLKKGGRLYLEIGYDQAEDVKALLEKNGFTNITVDKDLAGLDRIVSARYEE